MIFKYMCTYKICKSFLLSITLYILCMLYPFLLINNHHEKKNKSKMQEKCVKT